VKIRKRQVQLLASFAIQRSGNAVALELEEIEDFGEVSRKQLLVEVCAFCYPELSLRSDVALED
jgi:hypothetical protein